jgi:hypothetical protein
MLHMQLVVPGTPLCVGTRALRSIKHAPYLDAVGHVALELAAAAPPRSRLGFTSSDDSCHLYVGQHGELDMQVTPVHRATVGIV